MIIQHWWCVDLLMRPPSSPHTTDPWRQGLPICCIVTVSVSSLNVIAEMHQTRGDTLDAYLLFRCSVEGASITHHYPEQNHPSPSRTPQVTSYPSLLLEQHDMGIFLTKYFLSECSCSAGHVECWCWCWSHATSHAGFYPLQRASKCEDTNRFMETATADPGTAHSGMVAPRALHCTGHCCWNNR